MIFKKTDGQKGFMALMSAIIISMLLLAITVSLGFSGFFGRLNILDSESKERSSALAEACGQRAMLEISRGSYPDNELVTVGPGTYDTCTIMLAAKDQPVAGQTTIKTQGVINKAHTNLIMVVDSATLDIISWQEVPNF